MHHTITDIIQAELTRRLSAYKTQVSAGAMDKSTANHRYLALQTAGYLAARISVEVAKAPATLATDEEAREEIRLFIREINRAATVETMHEDGRRVALLEKFLEDTRPITKQPEQGRLL